MFENTPINMPKKFPKQVHQALKLWHSAGDASPLNDLYLAQAIHAGREIVTPHLVSNQILLEAIERMEQLDAAAADMLLRRFASKETAREVAYHYNVSDDTVYQRQRMAINQLAEVIWAQEVEHLHAQVNRIEARLSPASYTRLFGIEKKTAQLCEKLETHQDPWILALEGMGGIGKTSLADALARQIVYRGHFRNVAWISVRQRLFRMTGGIEELAATPVLSWQELVDRLIDQFDLRGLRRQSENDKLLGLQTYLRTQPVLMIVDNLETITDYRALIPQLRRLVCPGKFLITTRYSLRGESGVYILELTGLSLQDTRALIRHEAVAQGLHELAQAPDETLTPIYDLTGGNPLAVKLIIGQAHTFPLAVVLQRLRAAPSDSTGHVLLDFIHAEAWAQLDAACRQVMRAMVYTAGSGGRLAQVTRASGIDPDTVIASLQRLAQLSLVQVQGDLNEKRYRLHQLTRAFVMAKGDAED